MSSPSEAGGVPPELRYPVGHRMLTSVEEFRREFLPQYYRLESLGPRTRVTLEVLLEHAGNEAREHLDYGCSTGTFAYQVAVARAGWRITGWEGDPSAFAIADQCFRASNLSFQLKPYDAYTELPHASFHSISFLEVIEHVHDAGQVLHALRAALRPGGLLLLSTPNFAGYNTLMPELWTLAKRLLRRASRERIVRELNGVSLDATTNEGHVAVYSLHTLANLLRAHGFDLVTYRYARRVGSGVRSMFPETLIVLARRASAAD